MARNHHCFHERQHCDLLQRAHPSTLKGDAERAKTGDPPLGGGENPLRDPARGGGDPPLTARSMECERRELKDSERWAVVCSSMLPYCRSLWQKPSRLM